MRRRLLVSSFTCLGAAAAALCCLLSYSQVAAALVPAPLRSGIYNSVLLCFGAGLAGFVHELATVRHRSALAHGMAAEVARALGSVSAGLVGIHVFDLGLKRIVGFPYRPVMPLFDLSKEQNLPTLFATLLLLTGAGLFSLLAQRDRRVGDPWRRWAGLGVLFAFLALDEFAALHERLVPVARELAGRSLFFERDWVLVYGAALAVLTIVYLPFMRRLDRVLRRRLALAAVVYVLGAAGVEVLVSWIDLRFLVGQSSLLQAVEEALELTGLVVLVFALADHLERQLGWRPVTFGPVDGT